MAQINACSNCGNVGPLKGRGLCVTCYNREHAQSYIRPEITCSHCGKITNKYSKDLCIPCDSKKRWHENKGKRQKIKCKACGRDRPHAAHGLCASCHTAQYRKKNNYKGPLGTCARCGLERHIHAKEMCQSCYNKHYEELHKEERRKYRKEQRKLDPEKFRKWNRRWANNNAERKRALHRNFRERNSERLRKYKRLQYRKKINLIEYRNVSIEEKIKANIKNFPDLKRLWVVEFLNSAFRERAASTKHRLVCDLLRLVEHVKQRCPSKANAGWNTLELADIDQCQVETGVLKDSLRVFFRWLKKRKSVSSSLENAIPVPNIKRRAPRVSITLLKALFERWNRGIDPLHICIAGLLIIYFGMTNEELRNLKVADFRDRKVYIGRKWLEVDSDLWEKIETYKNWREEYHFGFAPEYFFVTGISVSKRKAVSKPYFASQFLSVGLKITPSELRKAMIQFHKKHSKLDTAMIASLFRISPKGASRHF